MVILSFTIFFTSIDLKTLWYRLIITTLQMGLLKQKDGK